MDTVYTGNCLAEIIIINCFVIIDEIVIILVVFRAAQTYSVPRKTLRNWMKRLQIKSAYPMPRQLKLAADRKKIMQQKNATLNIGIQ